MMLKAEQQMLQRAQTQQTQRSEFKTRNEEIIQYELFQTQRNNKMDLIFERINNCNEYLAKEQQRLNNVEDQIQRNLFLLEELEQELEDINSNKKNLNSITNLDKQVLNNKVKCIKYKKLTQELFEVIEQIFIKYFYGKQEFIHSFFQKFKNDLNLIINEYESQIQLNKVK